jgi:hypothetical protein
LSAAEFAGLLNAHAFLREERPPELWAPRAPLEPFVRLLGEMISAALVRNGGALGEVTLNVSNVVVEAEAAGLLPEGAHVAVTIAGAGDWPESVWPRLVNDEIAAAAASAGAVSGYSRALGDSGSVTVLCARA